MTLCDAGPLFALLDPRQVEAHGRCKAALGSLAPPLVTTWPSLTEAMDLAHRTGGWPMQSLLWRYIREGALEVIGLDPAAVDRMDTLMERYRDTPMDLADASLVAAAEVLGTARIFTLDRHFRVYRPGDSGVFDIVP